MLIRILGVGMVLFLTCTGGIGRVGDNSQWGVGGFSRVGILLDLHMFNFYFHSPYYCG